MYEQNEILQVSLQYFHMILEVIQCFVVLNGKKITNIYQGYGNFQ